MNKVLRKPLSALLLVLALLLAQGGSARADSYTASTMRLLHYEGQVEIRDVNDEPRFLLENARVASGESMLTGKESFASVGLDDNRVVTLDQESRVAFSQEEQRMKLNLEEGTLFLDVQDKLDENESFDIETATMTVGIRGTIVFVTAEKDGENGESAETRLGVLEGEARITYADGSGNKRSLEVKAGETAAVTATESSHRQRSAADVPAFVVEQVEKDSQVRERVTAAWEKWPEIAAGAETESGSTAGGAYAAEGDWTWTESVTLVAQSASKLYDGQPLSRPSDVLVYGLPSDFSIRVSARGEQTDAGESPNVIGSYTIYNAQGEDVTGHFANVETVSGKLLVEPAELTVWTGSAFKYYDGSPLVNPEAGIGGFQTREADQPMWRNSALALTSTTGSRTLYALSGVVWAHGTNPLTGEVRELEVHAGEKLTVLLSRDGTGESIDFRIDKVTEEELPAEILRLYGENPALLQQACKDAGWDVTVLRSLIQALPAREEATVQQSGLVLTRDRERDLLLDATDVRLTIDSDITSFDGRALNEEEAYFAPILPDPDISVTATGSRTRVGVSMNSYVLTWGSANPRNYVIREQLGTLTVGAQYGEVTVTAGSASRTYNGKALTADTFTVEGLPQGFDISGNLSGSRTNAGSSVNTVTDIVIYDRWYNDVTDSFPNINVINGTITVRPAPLTVTTGSAEKAYDGTPLSSDEAALTGLVSGETATVTATGSLSAPGSVDNRYEISWGSAKSSNYKVTENLGTLTMTANDIPLTISSAVAEKTYDGTPLTAPGYTVEGMPAAPSDPDVEPAALSDHTVTAEVTGSRTDAGSSDNTIASYTIRDGEGNDVTDCFSNVTLTEGTLTVNPAPLTIATGSATKAYDGRPVTSSEVTVTGLAAGETVRVTATGSLNSLGSADNTYEIEWTGAKETNYQISETLGTLTMTVNDEAIVITAATAQKPYDGTPLTESGVSAEGLPAGLSVSATTSGSQTTLGSSENMVAAYSILDGAGNDVTANFSDITTVPGSLIIVENNTPITITAPSETVVYNGAEQEVQGKSTVEGLPAGVQITTYESGWLQNAGSDETTAEYMITDPTTGDDATLWFTNVTVVKGTFTVTPAPLTVSTGSAEKTYDGTALISTEASLTGLVNGETATVAAEGQITDAGSVTNSYEITWGSANPGNYSLTENLGTLTVYPLALNISLGGGTYEYAAGVARSFDPGSVYIMVVSGPNAGSSVTAYGSSSSGGTTTFAFNLFTGTDLYLDVTAESTEERGTYPISGSVDIFAGASSYTVNYINTSFTIA